MPFVHTKTLARIVATVLLVSVPLTVVASSWSPTLLVNTESFQTIDDGDGSTSIELRFGTTGSGLILNRSENQFEFDTDLEVQGTLSGQIIHAQDSITTSGSLMVQGASTLSGAVTMNDEVTFGSGLIINGVTYRFPSADGSANQVLHTDGNGNLSWANDDTGGGGNAAGQGLTLDSGVISLTPTHSGTTIEATTLLSGAHVHAQNLLTGSGYAIFRNVVDSTTAFQVSDADGGTPVFNIDTTNERVGIGNAAPTYTLDVTGSARATTDLYIGASLFHDGDADTYLEFEPDNINVSVGAIEFMDLTEDDTQDNLTFNEDGSDIDFRFEGDNDENAFFIEGSTDRVGIGTNAPDTKFEVVGTISGSALRATNFLTSSGTFIAEGAATLHSTLTLSALTSCSLLTTDSNGQLVCDSEGFDESVDDRVGALVQAGTGITVDYNDSANTLTISQSESSGSVVSLNPEYDGAVYYGDGSDNVGQLVLEYDTSNDESFYKWTSTKSSLNDYTIAVRVRVPDDFDHWDDNAPILFRYRTNAASADDNQIDITMEDTAGSSVALTGAADLANTSWTTATITGPDEASQTYTPGSFVTLFINVQARTTNSGEAHAGYIILNWSTEP